MMYCTIGQAAKKLRVSVSTLKRWLKMSIIDEVPRNSISWRLFDEESIEKLQIYKKKYSGKALRFKN